MAIKKPFLNEKQQKARYIFAKNHAHWTADDWRKAIWTDELNFEIGKLLSHPRVWRRLVLCVVKYGRKAIVFTDGLKIA
ncbi:hypothetical protein G6F70_004227 [Rhizopus microsporus]|nr:hypothetical protein G6F71_003595 [Rhizopus microsporus]KAG1200223.1 hypothetical protein G6F70_004227 [Rhizopus microsporus]KAG1211911.1 hypothetical protein G6F69_004170 [Rhizopus microsporus]KAG1233850.1 hypothetical protein G6F67_003972 [Rhizopus microsporus]KAG1257614.1 hypothetical protein G6F68_009218 [Rhizopus microsporus]